MQSFDPTEQHAAHNKRTIEHWAPIISRQAIGNQLFFRREAARVFSATDLTKRIDFTARPVIVCGAGPSLTETLDRLTPEIRDRFTLVAVDTSFHPMLRRGVIPDLVVTLDPEGNLLEKTFRDAAGKAVEIAARGTVLLAPSFAHRSMLQAWLDTFRRPVYVYHPHDSANPAYEKLRRLYPRFPSFPSKPNVGQFSLDLAFHFGARVIAFAGLDLAYRGGKFYTDGVKYETSDVPSDASMILLGNDMAPVATSFTFYFDHRNAVDMIRTYLAAGRRIFNLSRGILPLPNALMEFFEEFGDKTATA